MQKGASPTENPKAYVEEIASLKATVAKLTLLIEYYESQLLQAKRRQFGSSSEKSGADDRQLNLFAEAESVTAPPEETEEIQYKRKKCKGKREEDLSWIPLARIDYELPESERACPQCGETMRDTGVDIRRSSN